MVNSGSKRGTTCIPFAIGTSQHFLAAFFLFLAPSTVLSQSVPSAKDQKASRPLHMLVLGDSILWGQGLKAEHKTSYYVKLWLEKNTGRRVVERIEAHSGAVIERFRQSFAPQQ